MTPPTWAACGDSSQKKDSQSLQGLSQRRDSNRNCLVRKTQYRDNNGLKTKSRQRPMGDEAKEAGGKGLEEREVADREG